MSSSRDPWLTSGARASVSFPILWHDRDRASSRTRVGVIVGLAGFTAVGAVAVVLHSLALLIVLLVATLAVALAAFLSTRRSGLIVVGDDGLFLHRAHPRFVSYGDIEHFRRDSSSEDTIILTLRRGAPLEVIAPESLFAPSAMTIVGAIRTQYDRYRAAGAALPPVSLARGQRSYEEWAALLRRASEGAEGGMRDRNVSRDDVLRLVVDPRALPATRAAAAAAMLPTLDGKERQLLRASARSTASDTLRVALDAAAAGNVVETMQAARELEEGHRSRADADGPRADGGAPSSDS